MAYSEVNKKIKLMGVVTNWNAKTPLSLHNVCTPDCISK